MDAGVVAAISRIGEQEWVGIKYPEAIWDQAEHRWICDAEVAESPYTAFTSRRKADHVAGRPATGTTPSSVIADLKSGLLAHCPWGCSP